MAQRRTIYAALPALLASLVLLAACGNRGSLYLPEEETATTPSATDPAGDAGTPNDDRDKDGDDQDGDPDDGQDQGSA